MDSLSQAGAPLTPKTVPPIPQLFSDAWNLFRSNARSIFRLALYVFILQFVLGIITIMVGLTGLVGVFGTSADSAVGQSLIGVSLLLFIALLVVYVLLYAWIQAAFILLFSKNQPEPDIKTLIAEAKPFIGQLWWASILVGLVVILGMILFVIPGIIFAVWFSFTTMIVVLEKLQGTDAMRKSKSYVKGKWWDIFFRVILLSLAIGVASSIVEKIFGGFGNYAASFFSSAASAFLFTPFAIGFQYLLYKSVSK